MGPFCPQLPSLGPVSNAWGHLIKFQHGKEGGSLQVASAFQGTLKEYSRKHTSPETAQRQHLGDVQALASSGSTSHLGSLEDTGPRPDLLSKAPATPCKPQQEPP